MPLQLYNNVVRRIADIIEQNGYLSRIWNIKGELLQESNGLAAETAAKDAGCEMDIFAGEVQAGRLAVYGAADEKCKVVARMAAVCCAAMLQQQQVYEQHQYIWGKIFQNSGEAISVTDVNNRFVAVNHAFTEATGYTEEEILGKDPRMLKSDRHDAMFYQNMWASILQTGSWEGEIWDRRKDGQVYLKWLKITQIKDANGQLINYMANFRDISERKAAEKRLAYLDRHDALTGLPNRKALKEKLEEALLAAQRKNGSVGVISINLDRFKNINDSLGHEVGDKFLQEVSRRLEYCSAQDGSITGRFGGDTFIVILPNVSRKSQLITAVNERQQLIGQKMVCGELELLSSASMGISVFPQDGETPEVLIRNADTAMHRAKSEGADDYQFFTVTMNEYAAERLILENDLRHAIARREFVLYYQPQVDIYTETVTGLEALIRWRHPSGRIISPLDFIPVAEETGLIIPLGEWVLEEACRQQCVWQQAGYLPLPVSVNISSAQFQDREFLPMLRRIIKESGIDPAYLDLEVTESIVVKQPEQVSRQLQAIKNMGARISLDDFGTGFSSLSYLRYFPLDCIKIDKAFIQNIAAGTVNYAIVEAVLALARSLRATAIAEGVETAAELECLKGLGCPVVQGYYYSKPLAASELQNWLKNR